MISCGVIYKAAEKTPSGWNLTILKGWWAFKPGHGFIFDKLEASQYGYEVVNYSYKEQYVVFQKIDKSKKENDDFTTLDSMGLM